MTIPCYSPKYHDWIIHKCKIYRSRSLLPMLFFRECFVCVQPYPQGTPKNLHRFACSNICVWNLSTLQKYNLNIPCESHKISKSPLIPTAREYSRLVQALMIRLSCKCMFIEYIYGSLSQLRTCCSRTGIRQICSLAGSDSIYSDDRPGLHVGIGPVPITAQKWHRGALEKRTMKQTVDQDIWCMF